MSVAMEAVAFEALKMVGGGEDTTSSPALTSSRPKRLILLASLVVILFFLVVVLNIVSTFFSKLTENEDFIAQLAALMSNYSSVCDWKK